jgi:hypothetical protein
MAAPAKFLFDVDFSAPEKREKAAGPAEIASKHTKKKRSVATRLLRTVSMCWRCLGSTRSAETIT